MKNLRQNLDDSLRPEYKRSDFGEMVQGKFANSQLEFAELVRVLITCIGEDEGLKFIHHSAATCSAGHKPGEWSYEIDNTNQIMLRYWIDEIRNIPERVSNRPFVATPLDRSNLHDLIVTHVRILQNRVAAALQE